MVGSELRDADNSEVGELRALERDLAILLAEEDIEEVGASLEPGSAAAVLVWENTWAAPFASAVRKSGGELLGSGRIPTQALSRRGRSRPPCRTERSMKMGLFRDRAIDPPYLAPCGVMTGAKIAAMTAVIGARTAATARRPPRPASRTRAAAAIAPRRDEPEIPLTRDERAAVRRTRQRGSGAI